MVDAIQTHIKASEYLELPESQHHDQLLNSQLHQFTDLDDTHQQTLVQLFGVLGSHLTSRRVRVLTSLIVTHEDVPLVDVFWIRPDSPDCVLIDGYWHGAPDLIVEILSPSTAKIDRGYKFDLYERCGVREYWIVDPQAQFLEVYNLDNGRYLRTGLFETRQAFNSVVLGFEVQLEALFEGI